MDLDQGNEISSGSDVLQRYSGDGHAALHRALDRGAASLSYPAL